MKTKLFFILTLAAAIFTTSLNATTIAEELATVKVSSVNRTLNVNVSKAADEVVEVTIESTEGVVLHTDLIEKNEIVKRYDLRQLPIGDYHLVVLKNRAKMVQPFALNYDAITIDEKTRELTMLPQVKLKEDKMDVRVFSTEYKSVTVRILDNQGTEAFQDTFAPKTYAKRYDLSKLPKGVYFVEVNTGSDSEYITIKL
jgi:Secretion system C-terminal sorting domain